MDQHEIDLYRAVLGTKMPKNDAGADTVREYLALLLAQVWKVGEDFSAKRPFGNSGWERELLSALMSWPPLADDPDEAEALITEAIAAWGRGDV